MCRSQSLSLLQRLGFTCAEAEEPYSAMQEICSRPLAYHAVILSLASVYPEELMMIATIKKRFGHIEVWLCNTDGRHAALAQAMRCGADGLLADDGLHRLSDGAQRSVAAAPAGTEFSADAKPRSTISTASKAASPELRHDDEFDSSKAESVVENSLIDAGDARLADHLSSPTEPVLTAEELRALLQEPGPTGAASSTQRENLPRTA